MTRTSTSVSRAVGSLVACDSACQVLTCHSNADSLVLAANNTVLSIASISRRNSDGPRFYIWHKGGSEFLFRASGRHSNVWILSLYALFLRGLTTQTDGWTVTQLHASRMLRTIWPLLHQVRCSTQSFQNRAHRWGKVVSHCLRANIKPPLFGL